MHSRLVFDSHAVCLLMPDMPMRHAPYFWHSAQHYKYISFSDAGRGCYPILPPRMHGRELVTMTVCCGRHAVRTCSRGSSCSCTRWGTASWPPSGSAFSRWGTSTRPPSHCQLWSICTPTAGLALPRQPRSRSRCVRHLNTGDCYLSPSLCFLIDILPGVLPRQGQH